jgi:tRNA 2-selenouridine synthase
MSNKLVASLSCVFKLAVKLLNSEFLCISMQPITIKEALKLDAIYVDTRSPAEFEKDHIPNSLNIPIFDNKERAEIGTIYKQNQDKAYEVGFGLYEGKLADLKKQLNKLDKNTKIVVYCWRGGLRSKTISELTEKLGYEVNQLEGGYKSYRAYMRKWYENYKLPFKFIMLQGLAGCGKTDLLKALHKKGIPIIDLEGLARHRSSLFGAIGLEPREQKAFETELYTKINELSNEKLVFIEGEAHKVGKIFVPNLIFSEMEKSVKIRINCSIENRSERIVKDYFSHGEDEKIKEIIKTLKKYFSNKNYQEMLKCLGEKNYYEVSRILLENYYDPRYGRIVDELKYDRTIDNDDFENCVGELVKFYEDLN